MQTWVYRPSSLQAVIDHPIRQPKVRSITETSSEYRNQVTHLFLQSIGDRLSGVGDSLLSLVEESLALGRGVVGSAAGFIAELLGGGLLALC